MSAMLARQPAPGAVPDAPAALLADLYTRHAAAILRFCRRSLRDPKAAYTAEDAAQDTWRKAWEALPAQLAAADDFRPEDWLYAIARHLLVDAARRREVAGRRAPIDATLPLDELSDRAASPEQTVVGLAAQAGARALVGAVFECLPLAYRHALWLREYAELSYAEIAALRQMTQVALKAELFRARRAFDATLRREQGLARGESATGLRGGGTGLLQRFEWSRRRQGAGACWPWNGARHPRFGFPVIALFPCLPDETLRYRSRTSNAQRVAWAVAHGPVPPHARIRATCGTVDCSNPRHLALAQQGGVPPATVLRDDLTSWITEARTRGAAARQALGAQRAQPAQTPAETRGASPPPFGVRWVTYWPTCGRYVVSFSRLGRHYSFGSWPTLEEASQVAEDVRQQLMEAQP